MFFSAEIIHWFYFVLEVDTEAELSDRTGAEQKSRGKLNGRIIEHKLKAKTHAK